MSKFKMYIRWFAIVFLLLLALGAMPSFASLFALLSIALLLPVQKWQALIAKYLKGSLKRILVAVFAVLTLFTLPAGNGIDEYTDSPTIPTTTAETTQPSTAAESTATVESSSYETEPTFTAATPTTLPSTTAPEQPTTQPVTTAPPAETEHQHSFSAATCTSPKVCSSCGATEGDPTGHSWTTATCVNPKKCAVCGLTEGSPAGHNWAAATCTAPATCTACGATEGNASNHNYTNGKCTSCGANDPNYVSEEMVWIPTKGGTKYHRKSTCSQMEDPEYVTKTEAINRGFTPCGRCY